MEAGTIKAKNISKEPQPFADLPPFKPGETRDVTLEEARILERSPFMEITGIDPKVLRDGQKTLKGVESDAKQGFRAKEAEAKK